MMNWTGKAISVGAALVDLLLKENDSYLAQFSSAKGGMTLSTAEDLTKMLSATANSISKASGGSSCNTALGLAQLGVPSQFFGRIGDDETGSFFKQSIEEAGVLASLSVVNEPSGQVLSVITPDAQRTMFTSLGASAGLVPEDLDKLDWTGVGLVHLEGYLAFNPPFFKAVIAKAKSLNLPVAMDLSSFDVVNFCRPLIEEAIAGGLEWIIANEDEAKAFANTDVEDDQLNALAGAARGAVLKLGSKGARVRYLDHEVNVTTVAVNAVDTTGAGDSWAAGFYAGLWHGKSLESAVKWGHRVAGEVVQVVGAGLPAQKWAELRDVLKTL